MKSKARSSLSWLLSILMVFTMMPAMMLTAYAETAYTPVAKTQPVAIESGLTYSSIGVASLTFEVNPVTDGGTLTAQWFKAKSSTSKVDATSLGNPAAMTADDEGNPTKYSSSYTIPTTLEAGTTYYYCTVTNTLSGENDVPATLDSNIVGVTVDPKEVTLGWDTTSFEWNGTAQGPTATVESTSLKDGDSCEVATYSSASKQTNIGDSYTATALTLSNSNYKLPADATCAFEITKITAEFDWGDAQWTGAALTPTVTVSNAIDGTPCTPTVSLSTTLTNVGDIATATVTDLSDTAHYALSSTLTDNQHEYTVTKRAVTITAKDQSINTGANIATGTDQVEVTGLRSGDTLTAITLTTDISLPSASAATGTITPSDAVITLASGTTGAAADYYDLEAAGVYADGNLTVSVPSSGSSGGGGGGAPISYPDSGTTTTETPTTTTEPVTTPVVTPTPTTTDPNAPVAGFSDVKASDYFAGPVQWAVSSGITKGTGANKFEPAKDCTRGETLTFMWRAEGCPEPTTTAIPFKDVKSDDYFSKAVLWGVEKGITTGTSSDTFSPNEIVNRADTVTFMYRAKGGAFAAGGSSFSDVQAGAYYAEAVTWAANNGITTGTSSTTFSPKATCNRGQTVTFLYRANN